jgi:hypothetical protein
MPRPLERHGAGCVEGDRWPEGHGATSPQVDEWTEFGNRLMARAEIAGLAFVTPFDLASATLPAERSVAFFEACRIPVDKLNRGYLTPLDTGRRNAPYFPIYEISEGLYVLPPRAIVGRALFERVFKGTCVRGIYDNMKTAVETIFVGKGRLYNRRFMQMCSHYLVDPVACTPASGWEKGQVENQVGLVHGRFFTPRLRFKTLDELNASLLDKCIAYAKAHRHPPRRRRRGVRRAAGRGPRQVPRDRGRGPEGRQAGRRSGHRSGIAAVGTAPAVASFAEAGRGHRRAGLTLRTRRPPGSDNQRHQTTGGIGRRTALRSPGSGAAPAPVRAGTVRGLVAVRDGTSRSARPTSAAVWRPASSPQTPSPVFCR